MANIEFPIKKREIRKRSESQMPDSKQQLETWNLKPGTK